mgnify:CR=1 FL=1|tara:strand:- start:25 stop:756 length:732 start_codon:yes stop_codon:yes gene_type:complete
MKIINDILWGAATQFGREFGRAGANQILKGSNHYTIRNHSDYSGRIKPSDSEIVRSYKEINKISFVQSNKANTSRLIDITNKVLLHLEFKGDESLNNLNEIKDLLDLYKQKVDHGNALIDDSYQEESAQYLTTKTQELVNNLKEFNSRSRNWIQINLDKYSKTKKKKSVFLLLSFPLLFGWFGAHKAYVKHWGYLFLSVFWAITTIPAFVAAYDFLNVLFMSQEKFDSKFNTEYTYYNQFSFI